MLARLPLGRSRWRTTALYLCCSVPQVLATARSDPAMAAQLTWARRLGMACDAAAGMLYLHTRTPSPIVHRGELQWVAGWVGKAGAALLVGDRGTPAVAAAQFGRWLCLLNRLLSLALPSAHRPQEPQPAGGHQLGRQGRLLRSGARGSCLRQGIHGGAIMPARWTLAAVPHSPTALLVTCLSCPAGDRLWHRAHRGGCHTLRQQHGSHEPGEPLAMH